MISTEIKLHVMGCNEPTLQTMLMKDPSIGWTLLDVIVIHVSDDYSHAYGVSQAQIARDRVVKLSGQPIADNQTEGDADLILHRIIRDVIHHESNWTRARVIWTQSCEEVSDSNSTLGFINLGPLSNDTAEIVKRRIKRIRHECNAIVAYSGLEPVYPELYEEQMRENRINRTIVPR